MSKLTVADIEAAENNPEYLGYGYVGERRIAIREGCEPVRVAAADALLLELVNGEGWTPEQFFTWLNSKNGRWFGELAFGKNPMLVVREWAARGNLMSVPDEAE